MPKRVKLFFDLEVLGWERRKDDSDGSDISLQREQYA